MVAIVSTSPPAPPFPVQIEAESNDVSPPTLPVAPEAPVPPAPTATVNAVNFGPVFQVKEYAPLPPPPPAPELTVAVITPPPAPPPPMHSIRMARHPAGTV